MERRKELARIRARRFYEAHREDCILRSREYKESHPVTAEQREKINERARERYAEKRALRIEEGWVPDPRGRKNLQDE
jgi:hypothetical protein